MNKLCGACWDIYLKQKLGAKVRPINPAYVLLCLPCGFLLQVFPIMLCILNFVLSSQSLTQTITSEMHTSLSLFLAHFNIS
jgi:hypothetical protein